MGRRKCGFDVEARKVVKGRLVNQDEVRKLRTKVCQSARTTRGRYPVFCRGPTGGQSDDQKAGEAVPDEEDCHR